MDCVVNKTMLEAYSRNHFSAQDRKFDVLLSLVVLGKIDNIEVQKLEDFFSDYYLSDDIILILAL